MLILLLCIVLTVLFAALAVFWLDEGSIFKEVIGFVSVFLSVLAGLTTVTVIVIAIICNIGTNGMVARNQQRYNSLLYQLENDVYDNDNDNGKKELYAKITDWNEDLAEGKTMQRDIWVGIFFPNIYDDFEFIELKER